MPILSTAKETLARIDALIHTVDNPKHHKMLSDFRTHWGGEVSGDLDLAMSVLPQDSKFEVLGALSAGEGFAVNTAKDHRAVYQSMLDAGLNPGGAFSGERFTFNDWGMMMEATYSNVVYGSMLSNAGDFDDKQLYLIHTPMVMICYFSEEGQMLGKKDFMGAATSIEPTDRSVLDQLIGL